MSTRSILTNFKFFFIPNVRTWCCCLISDSFGPFFRFRGIMAVLNSSSANLGWLVGLILGRFCPLNLLIFTYALPAAIFILISVFLPESPLWLTKHGQDDMAKKALEIVRGPKYPIQVRKMKINNQYTF